MRPQALVLPLLAVGGCFFNANHEDGVPEDKLPAVLTLTAAQVQLRPGTCVTLAAKYDRGPENSIVDLAIDGPGVLFDDTPGGGPRAFRICTSLNLGAGKVTATIRGGTGHAEVSYRLVLPASDELWRPEPLKMFGRTPFIPTTVEWSADGATVYVAYYDYSKQKSYLQAWDAATVTPKKQWVDLGPHVHVTGPSRAVTDGDAAYVLDLDHGRSLTWLPGPSSEGFQGGGDPEVPSVLQVRGVAGVGDVVAVGGMFVSNSSGTCTVASVNLASGTPLIETMTSLVAGQLYDPLTAYLTMSPNGRYLGWGGAMGCGTAGDPDSTFTQIYDLQENKRYNCGPENKSNINITGTWFSHDGSVFAYTQDDRVYVQKLPGCTEVAQGYDPSTRFRQVAVSPDGTHLAFVTYPGGPTERLAHIDLTPSSPALHAPDFEGATLTLGSTDQWYLPAPPADLYIDKFHEALAYSPDGKTIAVAQLGGRLHLVDIATGDIRSDQQGPLYDGNPGSRIHPSLSADGLHFAQGDAVMSLEDGHVVYLAAAAELIVEARDDGFVIEGGIPTSHTLVSYDDTSVRTPLTDYAPRVVDKSSPILHRYCGLNNTGNVCVFDPGGVPYGCGDKPRHGIDPSGILHWVMIGEARCAYETGGEIWTFEQQNSVTQFYATDPTRGRFGAESELMPIGHDMFPNKFVSVGATFAIWPIR